MKGVTTGSNTTFPSAAFGYSQANYSLSLLGSYAKGVTEGKGKAILSGEAYRFSPETIQRRRIPAAIYDRIRYRPAPAPAGEPGCASVPPEAPEPGCAEAVERTGDAVRRAVRPSVGTGRPAPVAVGSSNPGSAAQSSSAPASTPARRAPQPRRPSYNSPGITMSQELFDMAGFSNDQAVGYVQIR
jgi:hypothetical protein